MNNMKAGITFLLYMLSAVAWADTLFQDFLNPPKGYGNVPFFWWNGDSLDIKRLEWELDRLEGSSTEGFSISYIHTHPGVDREVNANGYGMFGKTDAGKPGVFTEAWWKVFNNFAILCSERGYGVGIDDYVIGWKGNGYYVDEIMADSSFSRYPGRLHLDSIKDKKGKWKYTVRISPSPELHPEYGRRIVETYFQRCYDRLDPEARKALNYFFQDELKYDLRLDSWAHDMPEQFRRRKGYDITPHLPALFRDMGRNTHKIRMDYADVLVQLAEERYFRPVLDWHAEKGLIYGCDNLGRGLDPLSYLDYFRVTGNFTAPGNDAPARGSSFVQTKVSSSISHMYGRPRTWLEAFHSMGWDANGKWLTGQLDHHLLAGGNLLCLHGLYYSTHGGWWEWAPPCFHFRMPYWPHMKHWLRYARRMCYILSQGRHVCDVAVLYPTETFQAYPDSRHGLFRDVAEHLGADGIDFDFVDTRSLDGAQVDNEGSLKIGEECYQALVLPGIRILPERTRKFIEKFRGRGGKVVEIDSLGSLSSDLRKIIKSDFIPLSHPARVLHRRVGEQDVYMVENTPGKDNILEFRASGRAELWNAFDGIATPLPVISSGDGVTRLRIPESEASSSLVVFSPGVPEYESESFERKKMEVALALDGEWYIRYIPTMDNRYGDFRLPASDGLIGIEAREMEVITPDGYNLGQQVYGFGPMMEMAVIDSSVSVDSVVANIDSYDYSPYIYSWQYGVYDNPGSQGFHGLKGKVDDCFLILDKGGTQVFRTNVFAPEAGSYRMVMMGVRPDCTVVDSMKVMTQPDSAAYKIICLRKGWNRLALIYADTRKTPYRLEDNNSNFVDPRQRSAVVIYPQDAVLPSARDPYGDIVAMRWYDTPHLPYDAMPSADPWTYRFPLAPGTEDYDMLVNGKVISESRDGDSVVVRAIPENGFPGASIFAEPIRIKALKGKMPLGDWSKTGPLKFYSGGIAYSKDFDSSRLPSLDKVLLSVGEVDATAEVILNGERLAVRLQSPFSVDISGKVKEGTNHLEIIVYSSLSNHYQTVPSPYRHTPHAGLIGPVKILTCVK